MMRIDIITGFPNLVRGPLQESIIRRAQIAKLVEIVVHDLRDFTHDKHKTIDDSPYGGGAGMILKPEPIFECMDMLQAQRSYDEVLLTSAAGERYTQKMANDLSLKNNIAIICGHYKGIDERVSEALVTREISIGDYILTGGELPALIVTDSIVRLIPGAVGDGESLLTDSFQDEYLDSPYYTRPPEYRGMKVPEPLLHGDHKEIETWRSAAAKTRTEQRRPDLLNE